MTGSCFCLDRGIGSDELEDDAVCAVLRLAQKRRILHVLNRPRQSPSPPPAPPFAPGGLSLSLRIAARAFSMPSSSRAQEKVAHARSAASRVLLRIREAFDRALTVLGLRSASAGSHASSRAPTESAYSAAGHGDEVEEGDEEHDELRARYRRRLASWDQRM